MAVLRSPQYTQHVMAMTAEKLHDKGDIAEELAARDIEIAILREALEKIASCAVSFQFFTISDRVYGTDKVEAGPVLRAFRLHKQIADDALREVGAGDAVPMGSNGAGAERRPEAASSPEGRARLPGSASCAEVEKT